MTEELLKSARERMAKSLDSTTNDFGRVRTGRANPGLLDRVHVDAYGSMMPLRQLATVGAPEPRLLTVAPFDKSLLKDIEKSISDADLGLNPANDGNIIRLAIPELNEERRRDYVKMVKDIAEEGRVAIRNIRRDTISQVKDLKKAGDIGEDDEHRFEDAVQKVTDEFVAKVDAAVKAKEAEIMEV